MHDPAAVGCGAILCPSPARQATWVGAAVVKSHADGRQSTLPAGLERLPTRPDYRLRQTLNNEYRFTIMADGGPRRHPADPDRALYVDRRFRALPYGRPGAEAALAEPAGRPADHVAVRAAGRLHAGRPRRASSGTCRAAGWRLAKHRALAARLRAEHYGTALVHAADLEIGAGAGAGRHSRADRLCRRGPLRPAQRLALGREGAAPHDRQERRAGAARRARRCRRNGRCRNLQVPRRGDRALAAGQRARRRPPRSRWRRARSAPPSAGPIIAEAAELLAEQGSMSGWSAAPARRPLAAEIVAAGGPARPRPHRHRSAQRHPGAGRAPASRSPTIPA